MARAPDHRVRALAHIASRMREEAGKYPASQRLLAEINRLSLNAEALDNVAASRRPTDTEAGHTLRVAREARRYDRAIAESLDKAMQVFRDGDKDVRRRIDEKVNLKPDAFAQENRAVFRGLGPKARADMINELIEAGPARGPELAALVRAPGMASGLTVEQAAMYERAFVSKHAGAELDEQQNLEEVFEAFAVVQRDATSLVKSLTDPYKLAQIEREDAEARAAAEAFDQSLQ